MLTSMLDAASIFSINTIHYSPTKAKREKLSLFASKFCREEKTIDLGATTTNPYVSTD